MSWSDIYPWEAPAPGEPRIRRVYEQLRGAIHSGALKPGGRLPSSRDLALRLGVARASVVAAYERLVGEGYAQGRAGSGTYVSDDLSGVLELLPARQAKNAAPPPALPDRVAELEAFDLPQAPPEARPFSNGRTLMDERALDAWSRATRRALRTLGPAHFGYTDACGEPRLRTAIADYLRAARGVVCEPDQVIVTAGAQHAVDLAARLLLRPGDPVWLEDPCYDPTWHALAQMGAELHPVPVDGSGIDVAAGVAAAPGAKMAFVTPSHQFPLGVTLSMTRRLELLAWARQAGAFVVEDDYASEFRYSGPPLPSLQGLDGGERVIYVGTLNKALFPGLRMGYMVAPRPLVKALSVERHLTDRQPSSVTQAVVLDFMESGEFAAHIRRRRVAYGRQRDALAQALARRFGEALEVTCPDQGMQLIAYFRDGRSDMDAEATAARAGLSSRAISRLYRKAPPRPGVLLGFSGFPVSAMTDGVNRLARAWSGGSGGALC
jgi:GntR family transcriptional regulator / MocR family aminotransferase